MVDVNTVELLAEALCGVSAVLFTFIASFFSLSAGGKHCSEHHFSLLACGGSGLVVASILGRRALGLGVFATPSCVVLHHLGHFGSHEHQR